MRKNLFKEDIGIDLGTANTLVYIKDKGIVLDEASVIAYDDNTKDVLAVGNEAKAMMGVAPSHIRVIRPLRDGVISDFEMTQRMLKAFINKVVPKQWPFTKWRIVVGVPSGVTGVEKLAVEELIRQMGAKDVHILDEPMAAAIGSGLDVDSCGGCMVTDIGGGTSDIAIIALGGIVVSNSLRVAGDEMNEAIIYYMRKNHQILIGEKMAERIKIDVGYAPMDAFELQHYNTCNVSGRDLVTGLPKVIEVTSEEICSALEEPVRVIVDGIKGTLEKAPPELAASILADGVTLTGGGSLLRGLDQLLARETGMSVTVADNPLSAVALGTGKRLEGIDGIRKRTRFNTNH